VTPTEPTAELDPRLNTGFTKLIGLTITAASGDEVRAELEVGPDLLQPNGICTVVSTARWSRVSPASAARSGWAMRSGRSWGSPTAPTSCAPPRAGCSSPLRHRSTVDVPSSCGRCASRTLVIASSPKGRCACRICVLPSAHRRPDRSALVLLVGGGPEHARLAAACSGWDGWVQTSTCTEERSA